MVLGIKWYFNTYNQKQPKLIDIAFSLLRYYIIKQKLVYLLQR